MKYNNLTTLIIHIIYPVFFIGLLGACGSSRKINADNVYFRKGADTIETRQKEILIQANDLLSIQVYSKTINQDQAGIFNIPANTTSLIQGYQVSSDGNIEMPVIGTVKAAGLTRDQLQVSIVHQITNFVKNPTVIVRFLQFNINVLGEVKSPGTQKFYVDRVTIIDALSAAGDLTDFGRREDVTVIREQNGKRIFHIVDLRSKMIFESPVYVLQPNDIVYVSPNLNKLRNLNIDPDAQRKTGLFFSAISLVLGIASFLISTIR